MRCVHTTSVQNFYRLNRLFSVNLSKMSIYRERVIFEDDAVLVFDKPRGMPSVPLREIAMTVQGQITTNSEGEMTLKPRNEQWKESIERTVSKSEDAGVTNVLNGLKNLEAVPRKEISFKKYLFRVGKVHDTALQQRIWDAVATEDHSHRYPDGFLAGIPEDKLSAVDIASDIAASSKRVYVVHRLDMETSGVLVFAKTESACSEINSQFRDNRIKKEYLAEVEGIVDQKLSLISAKLQADFDNRPLQVIDEEGGKEAETEVEVLRHIPERNTTLLRLLPLTGRTHQLRLHCKSVGHPILGDSLYAPPEVVALAPEGLRLHAHKLTMKHPQSRKDFTVESKKCDFL